MHKAKKLIEPFNSTFIQHSFSIHSVQEAVLQCLCIWNRFLLVKFNFFRLAYCVEVFVSIFNLMKLVKINFKIGGHVCLDGDNRVRGEDCFTIDGVALCFNLDVTHTACCYLVRGMVVIATVQNSTTYSKYQPSNIRWT